MTILNDNWRKPVSNVADEGEQKLDALCGDNTISSHPLLLPISAVAH